MDSFPLPEARAELSFLDQETSPIEAQQVFEYETSSRLELDGRAQTGLIMTPTELN